MFLTVHGAIGVIIGEQVKNPIWAFVVGLISHYIFDLIPHGDTKAPKKWQNIIHLSLIAFLDIIILIIFLLWLGTRVNIINISTAFAFLGATLPDYLQGIYFLSNRKLFKRHQRLHDFFHFLIADKFEWNFYVGLGLQITFFIILITFII